MELSVWPVARLGTRGARSRVSRGASAVAIGGLALLIAALGACGSELSGPGPRDTRAGDGEVVTTPDGEVADEVSVDVETENEREVEVEDEVANETDSEVEVANEIEVANEVDSEIDAVDEVEVVSEVDAHADPCAALADDTPCDDHNACTTGDRCVAGACRAAAPLACDDANPCTDDTCYAATGCAHLANFGACDDGDLCTTHDRCQGGLCVAGDKRCVDDNPCTRDVCDPTNAAHPCSYPDDDGAPCEDGSACSGGDVCLGGVCLAGLSDGCATDAPCLARTCAADGRHCSETQLDNVGCDDGNACTHNDRCISGYCTAGAPLDCGWATTCAKFHCDAVQGCVLEEAFAAGKTCNDSDDCSTGDTCDGHGVCIPSGTRDCDDHNGCTTDSCDPDWGCRHSTLYGGPCDDDNACTSNDACSFSGCNGTPKICDDANACTRDSCDPLLGCQLVPIDCDDHNDCTTDACSPTTGCTHTPRASGACDDHKGCTSGDHCEAGTCVGAVACDDDNPCTTDWCDAEEGCGATRLCPLGQGCNAALACVVPIGALTIASVVDDAHGTIVGVRNTSAATFDLAGFSLGTTSCGCRARVSEHVVLKPGETLYGVVAGTGTGDEDFVFGVTGDDFAVDFASDEVRLTSPDAASAGVVVATFVVGAD